MAESETMAKISVCVQTDICEMLSTSSSSSGTSSAATSRSASQQDLLSAWEELLAWSENAAAARKMQEEMIILKHALNRLGSKSTLDLLDTEPSIHIAIESLKSEKCQLQTYRTSMLRLNASAHSWLTRQEHKLKAALAEQQQLGPTKMPKMLPPLESEQLPNMASDHIERSVASLQFEHSSEQSQATPLEAMASPSTSSSNSNSPSKTSVGTSTHMVTGAGAPHDKESKLLTLQSLMTSENEFHKHLKDEVSEMYSAWDEADARINSQLEVLTSSLIAWRQLEFGLLEFQQALGQDRGTLKGLEGALDKGQATAVELAQNVKLVAKLLSERINVSQEQLAAVQEHLDPNHILHIAKFTASNGSLSDSGISDGGANSDGGLSERERRLGVLRRLAKQLESALAPGSEAMKSIAARMESAEAELKNLQNTCRDLIVRTAASHQSKKQQLLQQQQQQQQLLLQQQDESYDLANGRLKLNGHAGVGKKVPAATTTTAAAAAAAATTAAAMMAAADASTGASKRKSKRKQGRSTAGADGVDADASASSAEEHSVEGATARHGGTGGEGDGDGDGDDDPFGNGLSLELSLSDDDDTGKGGRNGGPRGGWVWRVAKAALPLQLALFTFLCYACYMQPNCCDNLNNLSMSFTPQLRYIRGPPPI